jgi:CheY-like chemotaxis protein
VKENLVLRNFGRRTETAMKKRADDYLVKPVYKAALLDATERCIRLQDAKRPSQQVLVVGDHTATREIVEEFLQPRGHDVSSAVDGQQARACVDPSVPALIILDLLLPRVGCELIAEWRAHSRTADLKIFVLTSKDLSLDGTKSLRANAQFLMHKQQDWQVQC